MGVNKVQYGSQVLLDISDATVTPDTLLAGESAYNAAGEKISGSLDPMLKSEYGGSGPGIVALADKANEANTANSANTAVNAQYAATAQNANNASKLGGLAPGEITPNYSAAETAMPYTWLDGKTVYRTVLQYAPSAFASTTKSLWVASSTGSKQVTMPELTKTGLLSQAASILPMSCACSESASGSFRCISYARPDSPTYSFGWRLDKNGSSWTLALSPGELDLSSISKLIFVIYYTK